MMLLFGYDSVASFSGLSWVPSVTLFLLLLLIQSSIDFGGSLNVVGVLPITRRSFPSSSLQADSSLFSSSDQHDDNNPNDNDADLQQTFPVLSKISGVNWEGTCRYVNGALQHQSNLKLTGGVRYDLQPADDNDDILKVITCTLTSFLTFPNGKTRQVQMIGQREVFSSDDNKSSGGGEMMPSSSSNILHLNPVEEGPIYMVLTEIVPDTILLNEIEKETGNVIMTSSISIPTSTPSTVGADELMQISHEIGDNVKTVAVEGHQVWRLKKTIIS